MRTLLVIPALWLVACSGDTTDTNTNPSGSGSTAETGDPGTTDFSGACGKTTFHTITVVGEVRDAKGAPVKGVDVWLEERNYTVGQTQEWGRGTVTNANGDFQFEATEVVAVEDCWGTLVDYHMVANATAGSASSPVNSRIRNAIAYDGQTSPIALFLE